MEDISKRELIVLRALVAVASLAEHMSMLGIGMKEVGRVQFSALFENTRILERSWTV